MQLNTQRAPAPDAFWEPPEPAPATESDAIRANEARRCHICQCPYPPFGFGSPLTLPGKELWACAKHRNDVHSMLAQGRTSALPPAQPSLF